MQFVPNAVRERFSLVLSINPESAELMQASHKMSAGEKMSVGLGQMGVMWM